MTTTVYVWEQEDSTCTGDIYRLVKAVEMAHYSGIDNPNNVITFDDGKWQDVTVSITYHGVDDEDWMHHELVCSWPNHTESAFYTIDGRA